MNAVPRWGKNSKLVLVSLLLTGLLLAALLVAGYYLKTHRKNSKGVRLVSVVKEMCGNLIKKKKMNAIEKTGFENERHEWTHKVDGHFG